MDCTKIINGERKVRKWGGLSEFVGRESRGGICPTYQTSASSDVIHMYFYWNMRMLMFKLHHIFML